MKWITEYLILNEAIWLVSAVEMGTFAFLTGKSPRICFREKSSQTCN